MIDPRTVQRILDAADIYEVVSDFVSLKKRGVNYIGLCPFHSDNTPSFYVSPAKGICKCFACGNGGNPVHFVMQHDNISYTEALRYLAKKYNIEIVEKELTKEEQQAQSDRESMFIMNTYARDYFHNILRNHEEGRSVGMGYFRQRGFREDIIEKFQLGYCTEHRYAFAQEAIQKGYKQEFLLKTGLCYETDDKKLRDRFWGRIIFPIHSISGKIIGFGGRVLSTQTKGITAKYVNSPESEVYHKSDVLYGIYFAKNAIQKANCCYIVEGYTDVISMHQAGIENVVAPSGTAFTFQQIKLIKRFTKNLTLLFDGDAAGIKAAVKSINMLLEEDMNIKICLLPEDEDPDSFARKNSSTEFQEYIQKNEVDFIRFKTRFLEKEAANDPIKRAELIKDLVGSIAVIPEAITRDIYIKECGQLLHIDDRLLVSEVAKQRTANAEQKQKPVHGGAQAESQKEETITPPFATDNTAVIDAARARKAREFLKYEQQITQAIVRYGEKIMCQMEEEDGSQVPVSVINYISNDLKEDDISFYNPVYQRILEEATAHANDANFISERFFVNHLDPIVSSAAIELATERYQLSKVHSKTQTVLSDEERLFELVPMLMINLKNAIVASELKEIIEQLKNPAIAADENKCSELMNRYKELKDIERIMAKHLGDRVVLR